ncbi:MAG: CPBP family intramembrane metalloprotease [Chloroflexi bacterium]|nr:CPBP family intramembrane metalloprotease [Chloroflexota bacterium]
MKSKWIAPILPYLAVWAGFFMFNNAWLTLLGFHLAILLTLLWLRPALRIGTLFKTTKPKYIVVSLLVGASSGIGLYFLWDVFSAAKDLREQLLRLDLNPSTWAGFIAYFSLVNPFIEEYFWRGALGSVSRQLYVGDLVYAGYHVLVVWDKVPAYSILIMLAALVFAGWFWRQVSRKDGGLFAPALGHMAADFSILMTVYLKTT